MSTYQYFPGCSLKSSSIEYDSSFRTVARAFDIQLNELDDWNCCGASPAPHHWVEVLGVLLAARNLHIASAGEAPLVAPCAGCYNRLKHAQFKLSHSEELRGKTSEVLGEDVRFQTEILNIVQLLNREITPETLAARSQDRLSGIKLGTYYGCLLVRPAEVIGYDDPRDPRKMEPLLKATGADVPHFALKTECCGSYMGLPRKEIVLRACHRIIEAAVAEEFDALVTACPLCQQNLDMRQEQINYAFKTSMHLPVLYYSQVIGLALGAPPEDLGLDGLAVTPDINRWLMKAGAR